MCSGLVLKTKLYNWKESQGLALSSYSPGLLVVGCIGRMENPMVLSRFLMRISYFFLVPKNPLLQLKPPSGKDKRNKKKNPSASPRKIQSPLKNKLLSSPVKSLPGACGSPQKLMDGFLKHEGMAAEKPLVTGKTKD